MGVQLDANVTPEFSGKPVLRRRRQESLAFPTGKERKASDVLALYIITITRIRNFIVGTTKFRKGVHGAGETGFRLMVSFPDFQNRIPC
jgi:hypothetical protein